jgi:hypothetical protein
MSVICGSVMSQRLLQSHYQISNSNHNSFTKVSLKNYGNLSNSTKLNAGSISMPRIKINLKIQGK